MAKAIDLDARLKRAKGREARTETIAVRFTKDELNSLRKTAESRSLYVGEWVRQMILNEVQGGSSERALFTEVVALRLLLLNALKPLVTGHQMSEDEFAKLTAEIRSSKHTVARDLLESYADPLGAR